MSERFSVELKEGQTAVIQFTNPMSKTEIVGLILVSVLILVLGYLKIKETVNKG